MLDSVPSIAAFATQLSNQKTGQQLEVAVLNKAKELQEQQGQAALKLLESAAAPTGGIDVRV
ncbi:YjfB family protein [Methylomonas sp. MED-D]|uniref:YjfB family protein n=1 Tax=unclassified Methylomonas TaxID=2608980 RepID=UPI0028A3ABDD|nr:YjfB family protein [Methylomonas sp. MV1]MDT4332773.1 YjfB family protein [Methylomonas sp. MV1]